MSALGCQVVREGKAQVWWDEWDETWRAEAYLAMTSDEELPL